MTGFTTFLASAALAAWLYLLLFRGGFWRADQRLPDAAPLADWPEIAVVIPARNEADVVGEAIDALIELDYPAKLTIVTVDDGSGDGTGDVVRARVAAAERHAPPRRLDVLRGSVLPPGWTGKLWAMNQGLQRARQIAPEAEWILLTDADIRHDSRELRHLVAHAAARGLDLASLMVILHCQGVWERLLVPAFVFFFQKLYPFAWVNDPGRRLAGAAGGCMLVRRDALDRIAGIGAIRHELIDDCALARAIKPGGPIWLGLARTTRSLRPYDGLGGLWNMVARSAFHQLGYSVWALFGTVLGMAVLYAAPPLLTLTKDLHGDVATTALAGAAWAAMMIAYAPSWKIYRAGAASAILLPLTATLYSAMTVHSAIRHWCGRGGLWKARSYAPDP